MISAILLVIITIFLPPVGVLIIAGCGADFLINLCLTLLGFFPGHIHAFYVEYVYYKRRDHAQAGIVEHEPAPGVFSDRVQNGGMKGATVVQQQQQQGYGAVAPPPGYVQQAPAQQGYYQESGRV